MRKVGILTREAEFAAHNPPTSFAAFKVTSIDPPTLENRPVPWADFALRCAACDGDEFYVGSYPIVAPDPSPYYEVAPGQIVDRPPHRLRCARCGSTEPIFDPRLDGYDGRLNGGSAYESGEAGEQFTDGVYRVTVVATYNISLQELEELAPRAKRGASASDLFDWFNIIGKPVGNAPEFEWSYQCA